MAYFSFLFCRKYHLDYTAAARGGILHDLYFANWQGSECGALIRWRTHPREALRNASAAYNITAREADIIVKHMWPLTAARPRYAEAYVVSMADKLAAVLEKTRLTRLLGIQTELLSLAALSACV